MAATDTTEVRGLMGWFAANHVAANLLMLGIVAAGIWALVVVKKESFPKLEFDYVQVTVPYLSLIHI